jgi:hypothetical protein
MERQPVRIGVSIFVRGIGHDILRVGLIFALLVVAVMV